MDSNSVIALLSNISIGTVIAWISVICAIIAAICVGTIRLYKVFEKYKKIKDENESIKTIIQKHDETLAKINTSLAEIKKSLDDQKTVNKKQTRYNIVRICDEALAVGYITAGKLRSLEEMYEDYIKIYNGNSYASTMVKKTRPLPVVGQLDE